MKDKKFLGIELGSTRIKAVLIDAGGAVLCAGGYEWENTLTDGYWSYALEDVEKGLQACYAALTKAYAAAYGQPLAHIDGMGVSAMMHGYLAFNAQDELLVPFRTWRNTNTARAAAALSDALQCNMPMRWSAAHYYQAVLDKEEHAGKVAHLHTLASYVHYRLTGQNVIGVGDASGMFPIQDNDYDRARIQTYNELLRAQGVQKDIYELLPRVLTAGQHAGALTAAGAKWLDPSGALQAGVPCCPPEGDAGTGMVATDAVRENTGNVSAGTSAFAMAVLDKPLTKAYPEIDMVTTPDGKPVAMVHVNNCTSEINEWVGLFYEAARLCGAQTDKGELIAKLFALSRESDGECGKFVGYNYLSGEPIAGVEKGVPMIMRLADGESNLSNFMQMHIYSAVATLGMGMEILAGEGVAVQRMCGHGGFFKSEYVGAAAMSAAVGAPVTVLKNAGEGGAWGIALLAAFAAQNKATLPDFLEDVFRNEQKSTVCASEQDKKKYAAFMARYKKYAGVEKAAAEVE